jgi:hypothetical protein
VARHLWQLVVIDAALPLHLKAIKDYLLLGRGDLFHALTAATTATTTTSSSSTNSSSSTSSAHYALARPPTPADIARLNLGALRVAARACGADDDVLFARVSLHLDFPSVHRATLGSAPGFELVGSAKRDIREEKYVRTLKLIVLLAVYILLCVYAMPSHNSSSCVHVHACSRRGVSSLYMLFVSQFV